MSIVWLDGFDSFSTSGQVSHRYQDFLLSTSSIVPGRTGGKALALGKGDFIATPTLTAHATYVVGFGFKPTAGGTGKYVIAAVRDATTRQITISYNFSTRNLSVERGGTTLGTGAATLGNNLWNFVELKVVISNTTGSVQVRVNTVTDINITNIDTQSSGNATANQVVFRAGNTTDLSAGYTLDDVYVLTGAGSVNNDLLGDKIVESIVPVGAGNTTQWTPNTPGSNFSVVQQDIGDNSFLTTSTTTNKDTYQFQDLSRITSSVAGVMITVNTRNTDSTSHSLAPVVRSAGSDTDQATQTVNWTGYKSIAQVVENNPNGSIAWTTSTVNAAEFGVKLVS